MNDTKLTSSLLKEIGKMEPELEKEVRATMKRYRTRNVRLRKHDPTWQLYFAEGACYTFYRNGGSRSVRMQHSDSLHAGGGAMSHQVGQRTTLPVGTWVVEFELFLGKPFVTVHHVGALALN